MTHKSGFVAAGPYDIDNVSIDSYALYTNMTPAGALRGFGLPQLTWAYESHTDIIARALKVDPVAFRKKNLLRDGRPHASGTILKDAPLEDVLDQVCRRLNWSAPFDHSNGTKRRGRGLALALRASISPTTSVAMINVNADGSVTLYVGTIDMGQGSDTGLAQIVGETLNIPAERVKVVARTATSRPMTWARWVRGLSSIWDTPSEARRKRCAARSPRWPAGGRTGRQQHSARRIVSEKIRHASRQYHRHRHLQAGLQGSGSWHGAVRQRCAYWMLGGTGAEVEVDTETGHVRTSSS